MKNRLWVLMFVTVYSSLAMDRKKRTLWGDAEIGYMLAIIKNRNIVKMLDGKRYRNGEIFHIVEEELKKRGFIKSIEQIRVKWKLLKSTYFKTVRQNSTSGSGRSHCPFYNELSELLGHRPLLKMVEEGVDTSHSMSSSTFSESDPLFLSDSDTRAYETIDVVLEETESDNAEEIFSEKPRIYSPTTSASGNVSEIHECGTPTTNRKNNSTLSSTLHKYTSEWKSAQLELQNDLLQKQKMILEEEFQKQREWEENLLRREQENYERMFMNISNSFFMQMGALLKSSKSSDD